MQTAVFSWFIAFCISSCQTFHFSIFIFIIMHSFILTGLYTLKWNNVQVFWWEESEKGKRVSIQEWVLTLQPTYLPTYLCSIMIVFILLFPLNNWYNDKREILSEQTSNPARKILMITLPHFHFLNTSILWSTYILCIVFFFAIFMRKRNLWAWLCLYYAVVKKGMTCLVLSSDDDTQTIKRLYFFAHSTPPLTSLNIVAVWKLRRRKV